MENWQVTFWYGKGPSKTTEWGTKSLEEVEVEKKEDLPNPQEFGDGDTHFHSVESRLWEQCSVVANKEREIKNSA